jgi:hypothetical protein
MILRDLEDFCLGLNKATGRVVEELFADAHCVQEIYRAVAIQDTVIAFRVE